MPPDIPYSIQDLIALLTRATPQPTQTGVPGTSLPSTGLNMLLNMNPAFSYTSPGTVASAFNPEMLVASGLFDPARVGAMQQAILSSQQADWAKQLDPYTKTLTPDFTDADFSYNYNPILRSNPDALSALTSAVFPAIKAGTTSAASAKSNLIKEFAPGGSLSDIPTDVQSAMIDEIENYSKELPKYFQSEQKFAADTAAQQAEAATVLERMGLSAPTIDTARMEFYKSIGMPQLALLPDVTEQYKFSGMDFLKEAGVNPEGVNTGLAALERLQSRIAAAPVSKPSEVDARKEYYGSRIIGQRAAEIPEEYVKEKKGELLSFQEWQKQPGNRGVDKSVYVNKYYLPRVRSIEATAKTLGGLELQKQRAGATPTSTYVPSVKTDEAKRLTGVSQAVANLLKGAEKRGQVKADELASALTSAGITPFQQAMLAFQLPPQKKK